ncbi:MAG TPA: putative toxin-antitoxin system toxin component, PIN family [Gaiellaceae bacterium]|nr:putative toxin-antitoxin system toxin component, PIN family [Gaiellaceae bacterium]
MRAVLDPNVLVSALLSRGGAPAQIASRWLAGEYELVVSELLLAELDRALAYPKIQKRVGPADAAEFVGILRQTAVLAPDPENVSPRSPDPGDDYLLALAEAERAVLVSGDQDLLGLADRYPIFAPREFLRTLETHS